MTDEDLGWITLGEGAFACEMDGRILAIVYWEPTALGELDRPGGEPQVLDADWNLVFTDVASDHLPLGVSAPADNAGALHRAQEQISRHLATE